MNYNVEDILNQEFSLSFRGYKPKEVDEFLANLAADYGQLITDYRNLLSEKNELKKELLKLQKKDGSL